MHAWGRTKHSHPSSLGVCALVEWRGPVSGGGAPGRGPHKYAECGSERSAELWDGICPLLLKSLLCGEYWGQGTARLEPLRMA